jgi:uncharacterized membrane protein
MRLVIAYATAAVVFLAIDLVWLGVVAKAFYRDQLGPLMAPSINWTAGLAFYVLYVAGLLVFVIEPALSHGARGWSQALLMGAFFGLVCYATYDLTNLATLRGWPAALSFLDMTWGAALTGVAASLATWIAQRF